MQRYICTVPQEQSPQHARTRAANAILKPRNRHKRVPFSSAGNSNHAVRTATGTLPTPNLVNGCAYDATGPVSKGSPHQEETHFQNAERGSLPIVISLSRRATRGVSYT